MTTSCDIAIVGGGIVGLATAMALTTDGQTSVTVLEAEDRFAAHQSGHNSGVIHSGLYYKPGSEKAKNCAAGRDAMYRFCQENGITHERCGKVVVATCAEQLPALDELERRGRANGLHGLVRLDAAGIREHEPNVVGVAGLFVPDTGIVDYKEVTRAFARRVEAAGGAIRLGARLLRCRRFADELALETTQGEVRCRFLINCAGLQCDRVARLCGVEPGVQIIPFRGEYYQLTPQRQSLIRNLVYPVPDPRFPFLGVHFTRLVHGEVEAGPNAVLALRREGYRWTQVSLRDLVQVFGYRGFWHMARKYWKTGVGELHRSLSKRAYCKALRELVPDLRPEDLQPGGAGVRAQAVEPSGALVDDFRIVQAPRMIHLLNAPSPGATASISIGRTIARLAASALGKVSQPV
jgi:L-2-hydroxyglutarate oxidase